MTTLSKYLSKETTKPVMTIHYTDHNIGGRLYLITEPVANIYKYTINWSKKIDEKIHLGHRPPKSNRITYTETVWHENHCPEYMAQISKLATKGWYPSFVHPMNGYEIQCLTKTVKLSEAELPKGRLIGIAQYGVLDGRDEIMTYIRDNFRGFSSVIVYKVPDNIEID